MNFLGMQASSQAVWRADIFHHLDRISLYRLNMYIYIYVYIYNIMKYSADICNTTIWFNITIHQFPDMVHQCKTAFSRSQMLHAQKSHHVLYRKYTTHSEYGLSSCRAFPTFSFAMFRTYDLMSLIWKNEIQHHMG